MISFMAKILLLGGSVSVLRFSTLVTAVRLIYDTFNTWRYFFVPLHNDLIQKFSN